jgi:hypothetical protein
LYDVLLQGLGPRAEQVLGVGRLDDAEDLVDGTKILEAMAVAKLGLSLGLVAVRRGELK